jgi:peroxin-6
VVCRESPDTTNIAQRSFSGCDREIDICFSGVVILQADIDRALSKSRATFSRNVSAPKIPSVTWDDVGGLVDIKADILDTVQLPMEHPELFADGMRKRSGAGISSSVLSIH